MIFKRLIVSAFESNCYIVADENSKEGMIIDPGDNADLILRTVNDLGLNIKYIFITHNHVDHVAAAAEVKKETGAQILMHEEEDEKDSIIARMFGLNNPAPFTADQKLRGWEVIKVGSLKFDVMHTPGHTKGGMCLIGEGICFTGDTLFKESIGRADFPGGDYEKLIESIKQRLMIFPDEIEVYPGHGPETTIGAERRSNPFLKS